MRRLAPHLWFGVAALAVAAALGAQTCRAAITYPWCTTGGGPEFGARNCGFSTREQCLATASGNRQMCEPNPFYEPPPPAPAAKKRKLRHSGDTNRAGARAVARS